MHAVGLVRGLQQVQYVLDVLGRELVVGVDLPSGFSGAASEVMDPSLRGRAAAPGKGDGNCLVTRYPLLRYAR